MTMMTAMSIKALAKAKPALAADDPAVSSWNGVYNLDTRLWAELDPNATMDSVYNNVGFFQS